MSRAFTLIELLVVIAIIGILAAIGLPALRGMTGSHTIIAANRQFLDDISLARQTAIAQHTTVYVVFVPTNVTQILLTGLPRAVIQDITNLYTARFTTYAILTERQVGDQPGRSTPKYVTGWRTLPNGVFIPQAKFAAVPPPTGTGFYNSLNLGLNLAFPVATNIPPNLQLPCLVFNYLGQLVPIGGYFYDQYIPLARGSIFYNPILTNATPDVQQNPPGNSTNNIIYINALTGRAKILQPQIR